MCDEQIFAVLFHIKKSKVTTNSTSPNFMRVTINGERMEISHIQEVIIFYFLFQAFQFDELYPGNSLSDV